MKIIDLLNKIANGEEVPIKFIWDDKEYHLQRNKCYKCDETSNIFEEDFILENLNDEVEILEEEKKLPKKYTTTSINDIDNLDDKVALIHVDLICVNDKVNKIIDYLESKGE